MSLKQSMEIWEPSEPLQYQITHFLLIIRKPDVFSHYKENGVPADFLYNAENYAINQGYDPSLCQKLQQIPIRESLEKKLLIQT